MIAHLLAVVVHRGRRTVVTTVPPAFAASGAASRMTAVARMLIERLEVKVVWGMRMGLRFRFRLSMSLAVWAAGGYRSRCARHRL
jgi:hypothetical protein